MRVRVLAAMTVAREFEAVYVWGAQTGGARRLGVPEETITAIRENHSRGIPPEDAEIVEFTRQLLRRHRVDETAFKKLQARLGNDALGPADHRNRLLHHAGDDSERLRTGSRTRRGSTEGLNATDRLAGWLAALTPCRYIWGYASFHAFWSRRRDWATCAGGRLYRLLADRGRPDRRWPRCLAAGPEGAQDRRHMAGLRITGFPFEFHVAVEDATLRDHAWNPAPELRLAHLAGTARPWNFHDWHVAAPDGFSADLAPSRRPTGVKALGQVGRGNGRGRLGGRRVVVGKGRGNCRRGRRNRPDQIG